MRFVALAALVVIGATACSSGEETRPGSASTTAAPVTESTQTASTSVPTPPSSAELVAMACAGDLAWSVAGPLAGDLTSVSGLAAGRRDPDAVWAVEDSLEPADLVAIGVDGSELARIRVDAGPVSNLDWEAVSTTIGVDAVPLVVIGDVGDNFAFRRTVRFLVLDEPALDGDSTTSAVAPRVVEASYVDGTGAPVRPNAEAIVAQGDTVWVFDKSPSAPTTVYRGSLAGDSTVLTPAATLDLAGEAVSDASLSPDGRVLALRTNRAIRLYPVSDSESLADALGGTPCNAPVPPEPQGEAVTILAGAAGLLTTSEDERGAAVDLHRIARR